MENLMENIGKHTEHFMENVGKHMENFMENIRKHIYIYGKSMGNIGKNMGFLWKLRKTHGHFYGKYRKTYGNFMENTGKHMENLWNRLGKHMEMDGKYCQYDHVAMKAMAQRYG